MQSTNKRPFDKSIDDVPTINKRPRLEDSQASSTPAVTWATTEPNPWGTVSWPVFPERPSVPQPEQPTLPPQPSLTTNVTSWEPFFALRKKRNESILKSESAKEKQRRENRERTPPTSKTSVYEWQKNDDGLYSRVWVTKSEFEDCFDRHGKFQRRYDSFRNEWDMCEDFGALDDRQIAQNIEDAAEMFDMTPEEYIDKTVERAIAAELASIDQAKKAAMGDDQSILSQVNVSVGDRVGPISHIAEEIGAPLPTADPATPISTLEIPTTISITAHDNSLPQVDVSVSSPTLNRDHTTISTVAHDNLHLQVELSVSSSDTISTVAAVGNLPPQVDLSVSSSGIGQDHAIISTVAAHDSLQVGSFVSPSGADQDVTISTIAAHDSPKVNLFMSPSGADQDVTTSTVAAHDSPQVDLSMSSLGVDQDHATLSTVAADDQQVDLSISSPGIDQDHATISAAAGVDNLHLQVVSPPHSISTVASDDTQHQQVDLSVSSSVDQAQATISIVAGVDNLRSQVASSPPSISTVAADETLRQQVDLSMSYSGADQEKATISIVAAVDNLCSQVALSIPSSDVHHGHTKGLESSPNEDESVPDVGAQDADSGCCCLSHRL